MMSNRGITDIIFMQDGDSALKHTSQSEDSYRTNGLDRQGLPQIDFRSLFDPDNEGYWLSDNVPVTNGSFSLFNNSSANTTMPQNVSVHCPNLITHNPLVTTTISNDVNGKIDDTSTFLKKCLASYETAQPSALLFDTRPSQFCHGTARKHSMSTIDRYRGWEALLEQRSVFQPLFKRENQKQIERKYRWTLNARFNELRHLLLGDTEYTVTGKRIQKSGILSRAIDKIKFLQQENAELQRELSASYMLINRYINPNYVVDNTNEWADKNGHCVDMVVDKENVTKKSTEQGGECDSTLHSDDDDPDTGMYGAGDEERMTTRVYAMFFGVLLLCAIVFVRQLTFLPMFAATAASNDVVARVLSVQRNDEAYYSNDGGVLTAKVQAKQYSYSADDHYSSPLSSLVSRGNSKITFLLLMVVVLLWRVRYRKRINNRASKRVGGGQYPCCCNSTFGIYEDETNTFDIDIVYDE